MVPKEAQGLQHRIPPNHTNLSADASGHSTRKDLLQTKASYVNCFIGTVMKLVANVEEKMRFRDLTVQIERFLKYAPKGTDLEVLRREAREFDRRLGLFAEGLDPSKVLKLREKLGKLYQSSDGRV